jgi:hypothetical protein
MTALKPILPEFVSWLDTAYGDAQRGAASEFAVEPSTETMAIAEVALEAAVNGDRPVLFATSGPVKPVIAALVLRRAGIELEQVFRAELTEEHFDALADAVRTAKNSRLLIESPVQEPESAGRGSQAALDAPVPVAERMEKFGLGKTEAGWKSVEERSQEQP